MNEFEWNVSRNPLYAGQRKSRNYLVGPMHFMGRFLLKVSEKNWDC